MCFEWKNNQKCVLNVKMISIFVFIDTYMKKKRIILYIFTRVNVHKNNK